MARASRKQKRSGKHPARRSLAASRQGPHATQKWSGEVTRHSNALDLERSIFSSSSPNRIAHSLKRSAEASRRRKGSPYQSAMSMLNFYINRGGANLSQKRKAVLERAKPALREAFGRQT